MFSLSRVEQNGLIVEGIIDREEDRDSTPDPTRPLTLVVTCQACATVITRRCVDRPETLEGLIDSAWMDGTMATLHRLICRGSTHE